MSADAILIGALVSTDEHVARIAGNTVVLVGRSTWLHTEILPKGMFLMNGSLGATLEEAPPRRAWLILWDEFVGCFVKYIENVIPMFINRCERCWVALLRGNVPSYSITIGFKEIVTGWLSGCANVDLAEKSTVSPLYKEKIGTSLIFSLLRGFSLQRGKESLSQLSVVYK